MNSILGPLGSTHNYIAHVALPNCIDYFKLLEMHREQGLCKTPERYKELRYALNAIESLNNILEYRYHETQNWFIPLEKFKKDFFSPNEVPTFVKEIESFANAYKHSVRGRWYEKLKSFVKKDNVKHSKDITENTLHFSAGMTVGRPLVDIQYSFKSVDLESLIGEAFRFWTKKLDDL